MSTRVAPATSVRASRETLPGPMALQKPCTRPGKRRWTTGATPAAQGLGVGLALVPQRVEARSGDVGRRCAAQVLGAENGEARVRWVGVGDVLSGEPVHQLGGEKEATAGEFVRAWAFNHVGGRVEQHLEDG